MKYREEKHNMEKPGENPNKQFYFKNVELRLSKKNLLNGNIPEKLKFSTILYIPFHILYIGYNCNVLLLNGI